MANTAKGVLLMAGLSVAALAGDPPRTIGPFGAEVKVVFASDGKRLGVTVRGGSGALVDLAKNGERVRRYDGEPEETETAIAIAPDGKSFALACAEGWVRVFDLESGDEQASFSHGGPIRSMAFTSDGKGLVTGGGLPRKEPAGEEAPPEEPDTDGPTARVWDPATGAKLHDLDAKSGNTSSAVAASPSTPIVAVSRLDGKLVLFDLAAKRRLEVEVGEPSSGLAFSGDGALLAALGGKDGAELTLVDVAKGAVLRTVGKRPGPQPAAAGAVAVAPDGKTLALWLHGAAAGVRLIEVESGTTLRTLASGPVASLAFSPDGKTLAAGLRNGKVELHDLAAGGALGGEKK